MADKMYVLRHISYAGISKLVAEGSEKYCVDAAHAFIARNVPRSWQIIERVTSREWEICEPEDSTMVHDVCGCLLLERVANVYEEMY